MSNYWSNRIDDETLTLMDKEEYAVQKQLTKLYKDAMAKTITDITDLYFDIVDESKNENIYLNSLYKYDRLYKIKNQLNVYFKELGEEQIEIYNTSFNQMYEDIQSKIDTIKPDLQSVEANRADVVVKTIWCSDNKHFSDRVWNNLDKLRETLIYGLSDCIVRGVPSKELKLQIQREFNVSYNQADRITRTELNRIRNQAMVDKYVANGYKRYKISTAKDDKVCANSCAPKENV